MAIKPGKESKSTPKKAKATSVKTSDDKPSASKKIAEEDDLEDDLDETPAPAKKGVKAAKNKNSDDEDIDDEEGGEVADDWEKPTEEDDDWDPDFDEFDLPKSTGAKKPVAGKKVVKDEDDDDFKIDDEFKDMFSSSPGGGYDDDDEDF